MKVAKPAAPSAASRPLPSQSRTPATTAPASWSAFIGSPSRVTSESPITPRVIAVMMPWKSVTMAVSPLITLGTPSAPSSEANSTSTRNAATA